MAFADIQRMQWNLDEEEFSVSYENIRSISQMTGPKKDLNCFEIYFNEFIYSRFNFGEKKTFHGKKKLRQLTLKILCFQLTPLTSFLQVQRTLCRDIFVNHIIFPYVCMYGRMHVVSSSLAHFVVRLFRL